MNVTTYATVHFQRYLIPCIPSFYTIKKKGFPTVPQLGGCCGNILMGLECKFSAKLCFLQLFRWAGGSLGFINLLFLNPILMCCQSSLPSKILHCSLPFILLVYQWEDGNVWLRWGHTAESLKLEPYTNFLRKGIMIHS